MQFASSSNNSWIDFHIAVAWSKAKSSFLRPTNDTHCTVDASSCALITPSKSSYNVPAYTIEIHLSRGSLPSLVRAQV